jgi:Na+/H+ antiporter NhaD/arsenite permease-like protein
VSNIGGALTPIGDPPLFLGYLKGVPFFWALRNLWSFWLATTGIVLGIFYA